MGLQQHVLLLDGSRLCLVRFTSLKRYEHNRPINASTAPGAPSVSAYFTGIIEASMFSMP